MSFTPYSPAPTSSRFRDAVSGDRESRMAGIMMGISKREADEQNKLIEKSGKYGTVAPVGSTGFAGDRLAGAIGSIGKAAGAIGGLFNQGGSPPWHQTTNFNSAGNTFSGFAGGSAYQQLPDLSRFKPPNWNPSSTIFGN